MSLSTLDTSRGSSQDSGCRRRPAEPCPCGGAIRAVIRVIRVIRDQLLKIPIPSSRLTAALSILVALSACASVPHGVDPRLVQPERPSVATHAGTVAPGFLEIETGIESDRDTDGTHALIIPTVLKLGVAPTAQLSLFVPAARATGVSLGFGDVGVGVKWRLTEGNGPLQRFAILPAITTASGGDRGTHTTALGILLIDSRSIGPVSLDLNVGLTRRSGDGSNAPRTATLWTASSAVPLGPLGWQLECFGSPGTHGPAGSAPTVAILAGPTLGISRTLALDAGVILPVAGLQPRAVYVGLVTNVGRVLPQRRTRP
jgi:hypothetical protein